MYTILTDRAGYLAVFSEMNNGEVRPVCIVYFIQAELPRRFFGNEKRRGEARLYCLLYTDRVTSPLFGNEQRRGEVRLYHILYTDRATSPLF